MITILFAGVVAAAALVSITAPAAACPSGYAKGWIQGHRICHLPPGGNNRFQASTAQAPQRMHGDLKHKLQFDLTQANAHAQQGKRGSLDVETLKLKRRSVDFKIH